MLAPQQQETTSELLLTSLWVHVSMQYILGPKRSADIVALGPKYMLYRYMDP